MTKLRFAGLVLAVLAAATAAQAQGGTPVSKPGQWLGSDKQPLPFQSTEEIEDFLRTANVVSMEETAIGVTKPKVVRLEKGGVQARGIFHNVDDTGQRRRLQGGVVVMYFRDTWGNQVAAYELAKLYGIENVPPTVSRQVKGEEGSMQLWIEGDLMTEGDRKASGKSSYKVVYFNQQVNMMDIFDNLINNIDRNQGNILWDAEWNMWLIDHTRAFGRDTKVPSEKDIKRIDRTVLEKMRTVSDDEVSAAMSPYMGNFEIKGLLARRDKILQVIDKLIKKSGEKEVVFDLDPTSGIKIIDE